MKPDADNIAKAILDALNELYYEDDSQVTRLAIAKVFAAEPSTEVLLVPDASEGGTT